MNKIPIIMMSMLVIRYAGSMLNSTFFLNHDWNGSPKPSKTPKNNTLLFHPFPFILLIELLTNNRNKPKPEPTAKKISKNTLLSSFNTNALVIIPTAIKKVTTVIVFDFFMLFTLRVDKIPLNKLLNGMLLVYFVGRMKAIIKKREIVQWFGGEGMVSIYDEMIERTKEKIQNSFLQLLKEKPFMKVSVRDITTVAAINRGTFYLHYVDKYDLLNQIEKSLLRGLELHLQRLKPDVLLVEAEKGQISTLAVEVFRYIQTNAERFQVLLGKTNHFGFHKRLKQFFVNHFGEKMVQNQSFFQGLTIPRDYLSSFATSAFLGLVEQWLDRSLAETPEEMADMYIQIIFFIRKM